MNIRLVARSFAIATVFSIVLLVTGSVGITVFALAMETDVTLGPSTPSRSTTAVTSP